MKTPEQMAEEYADTKHNYNPNFPRDVQHNYDVWWDSKEDYLAGYQAAKGHILHLEKLLKEANDTVAGMADECEGLKTIIYDHDETNLPTSANWISVKERLPEEGQECIFYVDFVDEWDKGSERINFQEIGVFNGKDRFDHRSHTDLDRVTHWMPLPTPPEE